MRMIILLALALAATPARAQEPTPFRWPSHAAIPSRISDGLVASQILAETVHNFRADDRWRALRCQGARTLIGLAANEGLKRIFRRDRPNHVDHKSFPSMHSMLGAANAGWKPEIGASITVGIGWGRMASGWHYGTDVLAGVGLGLAARQICSAEGD